MSLSDPNTPIGDDEMLLIAYLLEQGAAAIFRRICEDMHPEADRVLSKPQWDQLMWAYEQMNSQGRDYDPELYPRSQGSVNSLAMAHRIRMHLAAKLGMNIEHRHNTEMVMSELLLQLGAKES